MATRMQQRRGTASQWTSANPVLNAGEMGWESDTNKFKIGDGTNHWADLDYFADTNSTVNPSFGTSLTFEGATADAYETTLQVTDPTADRTITLPNASGTVITTGNLSDITDIGVFTGSITMEGTTADAFEMVLSAGDPTADRQVTFPDTSGTVITTGNLDGITSLGVLNGPIVMEGTTIDAFETSVGIIDPTADRVINFPDTSGTVLTTGNFENITALGVLTSSIIMEGSTADGFETTIGIEDPTEDRTISFPDASGTVALIETVNTSLGGYVETSDIGGVSGVVGLDSSLNAIIPGTSIIIEGATDNTNETTLTVADPTADRTITFPDATGTVALTSDITVSASSTNTFSNKSISLASNTVTGTKAEFDTALTDGTFVDTTSAQTLENKTLNGSQYLRNIVDVTDMGTLKVKGGNYGVEIQSATDGSTYKTWSFGTDGVLSAPGNIVFEGATDDAYETTLAITDPTADRTITLPDATGTVQLRVTDVSDTEIGYLNGVTSAIQTQIDAKASLSGATFTGNVEMDGNLVVDGDFTVNGTNFSASATSITIEDNMVQLAHQNAANTVDLGLVVAYTDGAAKHAGIVRDVSDAKWKLFKDVSTEPSTTVAFGEGSLDALQVGAFEASSATIGDVSNTELQYLNGVTSAIQTQIDSKQDTLPSQASNSGKYLKTDGSALSWSTVAEYSAPTLGSTSIASGATVTTVAGLTLTSPTINTPTLTLSTSSSTTDAIMSWDTTNKKIKVGNGTSAIDFASSTMVTNAQTASYTTVLEDKDKIIEMNVGSANTLTVPLNSSVAYPIGTVLNIVQTGTGQTTVAATVGVTINGTPGLKLRAQWSAASLVKRAENTWVLLGDIAA